MTELHQTPLNDFHRELGARMVPFAGWEMPLQYTAGIIREHQQCRNHAALFDVSHMLQLEIVGEDRAQALERVVVGDIRTMRPGRTRYTLMTNDRGGVVDDLMVASLEDRLFLVLNAARREADLDHLQAHLRGDCRIQILEGRALLALQGPAAAKVLEDLDFSPDGMNFLDSREAVIRGVNCRLSRLGYTGEDGFEISIAAEDAIALARILLDHQDVQPAGLGARDTLRLEAGLCLYGQDLDEMTTPVEAGLEWTIGAKRRQSPDFLGSSVVVNQLQNGCRRKLVGLTPQGKAPARPGTVVLDASGQTVGQVTSGGYGPSIEAPIALAYVPAEQSKPGTRLALKIRNQVVPCDITALPFVAHRYHRRTGPRS